MGDIYEELAKFRVVPVVVLEDAADAKDLAKALIDGGLPCAEVTFRTAALLISFPSSLATAIKVIV